MRNHLPQAPQGTQLAEGIHADEFTGADVPDVLSETFGYKLKRKLLGPPLVNEQMSEQRLSKPLALGSGCPSRWRSACSPPTASPRPRTAPRRC
jgi:hypothetical protein